MSPPPELVAALAIKRRGPGHPIPGPLKTAVVDFAVARRAAGDSVRTIAKALGMPAPTLRAWLVASPKRGLVPVQLTDDRTSPEAATTKPVEGLRLECPGGFVVHGLNTDQLVAVLRGLS